MEKSDIINEILDLVEQKISKWEKERDDGRGYIDAKIRVLIDQSILKDLREIRQKILDSFY